MIPKVTKVCHQKSEISEWSQTISFKLISKPNDLSYTIHIYFISLYPCCMSTSASFMTVFIFLRNTGETSDKNVYSIINEISINSSLKEQLLSTNFLWERSFQASKFTGGHLGSTHRQPFSIHASTVLYWLRGERLKYP